MWLRASGLMCGFSGIFRAFPEELDSWAHFHSSEHHWTFQGPFHTWIPSTLLFKAVYGAFLPGTLFICFCCLHFCLWSLSILKRYSCSSVMFLFICFFVSLPHPTEAYWRTVKNHLLTFSVRDTRGVWSFLFEMLQFCNLLQTGKETSGW